MRAGPDVPDPRDRRPVARLRAERPPEEVLVEGEGAAVGVALAEVDVRCLQIGGRERGAGEDRRLQVRDVAGEARLDPLGVALAELLCPFARADVKLARGVALDARSEEHTSELQSRQYLVCRLLLEKKKKIQHTFYHNKKKKK